MSPRSRRHGVPPPAFLGVLVAMLLALGLAGTTAAGAALPAQDVVVSVTAGANDPVRGATVVARDDRTGRVMSNATTTGYLGYAAIRLRPGASTRRITITATGGRSKAVGTLSAADVMSATAQRAVMASEIEVNVNPGSTVLAEYLDERPRASVAAAERAVARRLRLPTGTDVAESARFSRVRFSGEDFIDAARKRGGVEDYAEWAAERISAGDAVRSFADSRPADDLPLQGAPSSSPAGAGLRREQGGAGAAASVGLTLLKPLIELGAKKAYCAMGLTELCNAGTTTTTPALSEAEKKKLDEIATGISNLSTQMTTTQQSLSAVEVQVAALGGQVAALKYTAEMNAVDDVIRNTRIVAGLRAQENAGKEGSTPSGVQALKNALLKRHDISSGCPDWAALVGTLPPAAVMDGSSPRYPIAACTSSAAHVRPRDGLLQFAQRTEASMAGVVTAGLTQAAVDSAGEFWLGEFARNVFAMNAAAAYALRPGGSSTWTPETAEATSQIFSDALELIDIDATGTYFGARIPADQVLRMGSTTGTLYGIGRYLSPPTCFGDREGFTVWKREPRNWDKSYAAYFPTFDMGTAPAWAAPVRSGACQPEQVVGAPPPIPGAPAGSWTSPDTVLAADLGAVLPALRRAALCHMKDYVDRGTALRAQAGEAAGGLCDPYPTPISDEPLLSWPTRNPTPGRVGEADHGVLPNLQLSLRSAACHPWMFGTLWDEYRPNKPREASTPPWALATASGMQCPVLDLTPRAESRYGWNCVKAAPSGQFIVQHSELRLGTTSGGRTVGWALALDQEKAPLRRHSVTASLTVLNKVGMGGYCPSLGARPAPPGADNVSHMVDPNVLPSAPTDRRRDVRPRICSPAFIGLYGGFNLSEDYPCASARGTGPDDHLRSPQPQDNRALWPLQRQIRTLTTYSVSGKQSPGYQSENWTYNNDVAGDFVVGPLYTSNFVGAYVPGTSPGQPTSSAPPRRAGARAPDAVRDVTACGEECTGDPNAVRVQWRPPLSSGGLGLRTYKVVATSAQRFGWPRITRVCTAPASASTLQCVLRDLDLSQRWEILVEAANPIGTSQSTMSYRSGPGRPTVRPMLGALEVGWTTPRAWVQHQGLWGQESVKHSYTATASPGGRSCTVARFSSTTCTISGLTPGTAYTVTVVLSGSYSCGRWIRDESVCFDKGTSPPSAPAMPLGPPAVPGAPGLDAAVPSEGRIAVTWRAPVSDGNSRIAGYTATAMPGGATCTTTGSLACTIDGLSPGTEYTVSVTATNAMGTGPPSERVTRLTPAVAPGPPLTPLAKASPGTIEVSWVAPDFDGGAAITGYTATATPGGAQCTTDGATTCTITGLPDGTEHQVTVMATNAVGPGPASLPAAARTPDLTAPGAPRSVELTALPGRIEVAWSAPESDGGSLVTGYIATASPGGATCTTTGATLCTITGLDDGTAYRVAVAAINVIGTGEPSDSGEAVTPRRDEGGAAPVVDDLPLQATSIPGTAESGLPAGAPIVGRVMDITGLALRPRTLVPGLGGRIAYTLSEPADVTITIARVGGRDRASRVVHRIPAGRPGALAGDTRIRVLYSFASARRKKPGAWTLTVEARDAQGGVATKTIPIRVRT